MTDGVIKGTGNSRYLKTVSNAPTQYPTYEAFIQALAAGTLPIDLNGINSTGWTQTGTPLNKANLLTDATAALAGLASTATPNTMFAKLANLITSLDTEVGGKCSIETGSYVGVDVSGTGTPKTLTFSRTPQVLFVNAVSRTTDLHTFQFVAFRGHPSFGVLHQSLSGEMVDATFNDKSVTLQGDAHITNNTYCTYYYLAICL